MKKHYTSVISNTFGKFASKEFSPSVQNFINKGYVKLMGLDMSAFKEPSEYKTLNKLFTRSFVKSPKLPEDKSIFVSPVDGLITDAGEIVDGKAYQIKGMSYDMGTLFGAYYEGISKNLEGGEFINFYLSPKDYHRYHMPMTLNILSLTHIPGKLYPVNFPLLRNMPDLFIENERVVIECKDEKGRLHMLVLVGALNVGKMIVSFEKSIRTNSELREEKYYAYDKLKLERGELFGWFEMGSTILTFSQKGSISPDLEINQKVSFSDDLGTVL